MHIHASSNGRLAKSAWRDSFPGAPTPAAAAHGHDGASPLASMMSQLDYACAVARESARRSLVRTRARLPPVLQETIDFNVKE